VPPPNREEIVQLVDARAPLRRLQSRSQAISRKLARVTARLAAGTLNQARATAEIARLQAQLAQVNAELVEAQAQNAEAALPFLAARYGVPGYRNIAVRNATGEPLPFIGDVRGASYFDSKGNAKRAKNGGGSKRVSYWDFITDICIGTGFICYVKTPTNADGTLQGLPPAEIVIDRPKTYYKKPGERDQLRRYQYGINVDSLSIQRSFNGRNIPTGVAVSAIESKTGNVISTRFPPAPKGTRQQPNNRPGVNPAGLGDRSEYQTLVLKDRIPGDDAVETLRRLAENLYEQLSRGEMMLEIQTTSLSAFPATRGQSIPDIFQLRAGDPIEIAITPSLPVGADSGNNPLVTQAGNWWKDSPGGRASFLSNVLGVPVPTATELVAASESELLQNVFYTREVGIEFDAGVGGGGGFAITIQAINYLDARNSLDAIQTNLQGGP